MERYAAYCGTRAIYGDMETSAKSLIGTTDVDRVYFIIEDAEFPSELPDIVETIDMGGQTFFEHDGPNMKSRYTWMAMMRIALCHILPVDMVLSLDADTICMGDASGVWDLHIGDCYLAATPEWHRSEHGLQYCNFGVVLYNLAKMRDGKADECIEVLNRRCFEWVEQDVGNYLCQGRICEMPTTYNGNYWTNHDAPDPTIRHFAGVPHVKWVNRPEVVKWRSMGWDEVMALHG